MKIKLKKDMELLKREVILKSVDLDEDIDDFEVKIESNEIVDKFFTVSPRCVRCDLCVEECPVDAISPSNYFKTCKIEDNCVKCEICAQTCPVACIYIMESKSIIDEESDIVKYELKQATVPHRIIRMEDISIDRSKCDECGHTGDCIKFCPTKAFSLKKKSYIEIMEDMTYPSLEDREYPYIEKKLCIGCGSCVNLCKNNVIKLKRTLGPVIKTHKLNINQEECVQCYLCEETCPVSAIRLENDKVILDNEKCINCNVCSSKCPVDAVKLEKII